MRRKIKEFFSRAALRNLLLIPLVIVRMENWAPFLWAHIGLTTPRNVYAFRNGMRLATDERFPTTVIMDCVIGKDYGDARDGMTIVDIGAHIGAYSLFASFATKDTRIYAYEPAPENYRLLLENIALNGLNDRIMPFNRGVAAVNGKRMLCLAPGSGQHSLHPRRGGCALLEIECVSLEDILLRNGIARCDILKMDCEGAEYEILLNAPDECLTRIRAIRMEYHDMDDVGNRIDALIARLEMSGFMVHRLRRDAKGKEGHGILWVRKTGGMD